MLVNFDNFLLVSNIHFHTFNKILIYPQFAILFTILLIIFKLIFIHIIQFRFNMKNVRKIKKKKNYQPLLKKK